MKNSERNSKMQIPLHEICLTFRTSWSLAGLVDLGVLSGLGSSFKSIGSRFLALIAVFIRAKMSSMNLLYLAISFRPSSIGSKSERKQTIIINRGVARGGARGARAPPPPEFCRSVNPIQTMGGRLCPPHYCQPPGFKSLSKYTSDQLTLSKEV